VKDEITRRKRQKERMTSVDFIEKKGGGQFTKDDIKTKVFVVSHDDIRNAAKSRWIPVRRILVGEEAGYKKEDRKAEGNPLKCQKAWS